MLRKVIKVLSGLLIVSLLIGAGICVFGLYITRKLPWQQPVFETILPADPGLIREKGVLVFSKTNGFSHQSIEPAIAALQKAGKDLGWDIKFTESGAFFNDQYLNRFKVVVFLSTTGDILTPEQEKSFEKFIQNGGGYAGIHSASDTEYDWKWYGQMLGTRFRDHTLLPQHTPEAEIITETQTHPATKHLPKRWNKTDEWYNFKSSVRSKGNIQVLLSVNDSSYTALFPQAMHYNHPISWTNIAGKGRIFYTAIGHNSETFTDKYAMPHIIEGIAWAARF